MYHNSVERIIQSENNKFKYVKYANVYTYAFQDVHKNHGRKISRVSSKVRIWFLQFKDTF